MVQLKAIVKTEPSLAEAVTLTVSGKFLKCSM